MFLMTDFLCLPVGEHADIVPECSEGNYYQSLHLQIVVEGVSCQNTDLLTRSPKPNCFEVEMRWISG